MKLRLPLLIAACAVVLVIPASASASAPTTTNITTPTSGATLLNDTTAPSPITISGTSTGFPDGAMVDVRCYFNSNNLSSTAVATNVSVTSNAFSTTAAAVPKGPCVLRAIPSGSSLPLADVTPYAGPLVLFNLYRPVFSGPNQTRLDAQFSQSKGGFLYSSVDDCGLQANYFVGDGTGLQKSFHCNQYYAEDVRDSPKYSLRVDGKNAYTANAFKAANLPVSVLQLSTSYSVEPVTGDVTITERDSIAVCTDDPAPSSPFDCVTPVDSGVKLTRTIKQSKQGRQSVISDVYSSSDNASHSLQVGYQQDMRAYSAPNFDFSGTTYNTPANGTNVPGPFADNSQMRYYDANSTSPIVYSSIAMSPGADSVQFGPYMGGFMLFFDNRSVSAGSPLTITGTYRHGLSTAELDELAAEPVATSPSSASIVASGKPGAKYDKKSRSVIVSTGRAVSCPAGGGVCTVTGSLAVKYKKGGKTRTLRLRPAFSSVTPGSTQPLTFSMKIKNNPLFKPAKKAFNPLYGSLGFSGQATATASGAPAAQGSLAFKLKMPKIRR